MPGNLRHLARWGSGSGPGLATALLMLAAAAAPRTVTPAEPASPAKPNVLFIAIDDLNHWVGHLGRNPQVKTPHIDRLAARGVTFSHAYCAAPLCNASRAALLSGLRPSTSGVYENGTDWRPLIPEAHTLPSHFRRQGYHVAGAGKIYHGSFERRGDWDDYYQRDRASLGVGGSVLARGGAGGISFAELEGGDEIMDDHRVVSWTIEQLQRKHHRPFFLACGLYRPHLPWNVPKKYFDLYSSDEIRLPEVLADDLDDIPPAGARMANPQGDHAAILKAGIWKQAVRGYLASISFADAEVGRLINALDASPYRDSTVVVLWGDNGWHLGEKLHWRKFTLWEEATRVPLIWVAPGVTKPGGICRRAVDFMTIYPTLCDLCAVPIPPHVEGKSLRSLLEDPTAEWKAPAVTTYLYQNHAVRAEAWRYIRYADGGEELYDEVADPLEWKNLAGEEKLAAVKADLSKHLPTVNRPPPGDRNRAKEKAAGRKKARARKTGGGYRSGT